MCHRQMGSIIVGKVHTDERCQIPHLHKSDRSYTHMLGAQEQTQKTYNCQHANSPTQPQSIKEKCQRASRAFTLSPSAEQTIRGHKKLKIRTE